MRIALFGSTGHTGRLIVREALEGGHQVTAFARDPAKLDDLRDAGLSVVAGDLSDVEAIRRTIDGADAVISVLGPGSDARGTELSEGVRHIIDVMETLGVRRLVALSTASLKDPMDRFDVAYFLLVTAVRLLYRGAYEEIVRMGSLVRRSETDWTIVRIGLLTNRAHTAVRAGYYGRGQVGVGVSRSSVARYVLALATTATQLHQSPAISN